MLTSLKVVRMALVAWTAAGARPRGAQARHGHALLGTVAEVRQAGRRGHGGERRARGCGRGRRSGRGPGGRAGGQRADHVALGHAAVAAGAGDAAGGQVLVGHHLGRRGHRHPGLGAARCRRRDRLRGHRAGRGLGRLGRGRRRRGGAGLALGVDLRDHLLGHDGGTVARHDLAEHAGGRRGDFQHHLVGLDLDQDLVLRHGFAGLLLPLQQGGLGNRFGQLRDLDFNDSHLSCFRCS